MAHSAAAVAEVQVESAVCTCRKPATWVLIAACSLAPAEHGDTVSMRPFQQSNALTTESRHSLPRCERCAAIAGAAEDAAHGCVRAGADRAWPMIRCLEVLCAHLMLGFVAGSGLCPQYERSYKLYLYADYT